MYKSQQSTNSFLFIQPFLSCNMVSGSFHRKGVCYNPIISSCHNSQLVTLPYVFLVCSSSFFFLIITISLFFVSFLMIFIKFHILILFFYQDSLFFVLVTLQFSHFFIDLNTLFSPCLFDKQL